MLFIKDVVLKFLDDEAIEVRKVAAKAGRILCVKSPKNENYLNGDQEGDVLEKFLNISMSDPNPDIREIMLSSFHKDFDRLLSHQRYLKMLFICFYDPVAKIQTKAMEIVCKIMFFYS